MLLHYDDYGVIRYDREEGLLALEWLPASEAMSDDDYMTWLETYANYAEHYRPAHLIMDLRQLRYHPAPRIERWRKEFILPRYNESGVHRLACLVRPTQIPGGPPQREDPGTFLTGYFDTLDAVKGWLDVP